MKRFSPSQILGGILTVVVLSAIVAALLVFGSPAEERARRLDARRVQDLTNIANAIDVYWTRHARLPASLEELRNEPVGHVDYHDPRTNDTYGYRSLEPNKYELCGQFDGDSRSSDRASRDGFWSHGAGRQCFQREANKIR